MRKILLIAFLVLVSSFAFADEVVVNGVLQGSGAWDDDGAGTVSTSNDVVISGTLAAGGTGTEFTVDSSGNIVANTVTTSSTPLPAVNFYDSDGTDDDINGKIRVNLTDTGSGSEDADMTISLQVAGSLTDMVKIDGDGTSIEMPVPASAPTVSANARIIFYLDETGHNLKAAVKYSDGTTKTFTAAFD